MPSTFFITGTDTEIGKTFVTTILLQAIAKQGFTVSGFKPVASEATLNQQTGQLENSDALALLANSNIPLTYSDINPYCLAEPTSPHIASQAQQITIQSQKMDRALTKLQLMAQYVLIEGAGGWFTPLTDDYLYSDWVIHQKLPVILVVGMKLGCINHALLTQQAIKSSGLTLCGWVANSCISQGNFYPQYLQTLIHLIDAPLIAELPFMPNAQPQQFTYLVDPAFFK